MLKRHLSNKLLLKDKPFVIKKVLSSVINDWREGRFNNNEKFQNNTGKRYAMS